MCKISALFLLMVASIAAVAQGPNNGVSVQIQPQSGGGRYCMDARGNRDQDGVPVFIYQCHDSENQRWTITTSVDNRHAIVGIGGYCLDVRGTNSTGNGTPTQLWKCHFGDNQRFSLEPDGRIKEVRSGKCLIATAAQDAAPLVLDTCKNTIREIFMIRR
jgi:hypothetical protein